MCMICIPLLILFKIRSTEGYRLNPNILLEAISVTKPNGKINTSTVNRKYR